MFRGEILPDDLMSLIDHLPRHSRLAAAMADDDELAELMEGTPVSQRPPPLTEWTPETDALAKIADRVGTLIEVVTGALGGTAKVPPVPRPETARDRLKTRREDEFVAGIEDDIKAAQQRWLEENPEEG